MEIDHISNNGLVRLLDDELEPSLRMKAESHVANCPLCRQKLAELQHFSMELDAAVNSIALPGMPDATQLHDARQLLMNAMETPTGNQPPLQRPGHVMRRFGWGMGIAATLAFAVLMAPRHDWRPQPDETNAAQTATGAQAGSIEVDGETFLPVPYSNADLSTSVPHIVQMQVPVASLADIGIVLEPVTSRVSGGPETERSVLADVLVGADGQPRGVHVIGAE